VTKDGFTNYIYIAEKASFSNKKEQQIYFWWDSLANANVPFKLRLKNKKKN